MSDLETQIADELNRIVAVVSEITGLPSRWSGRVELVPNADFKGKKRFRCDILIQMELAQTEARWTTLIHEALHTFSSGYLREDYQAYRGWEEGVVEQLQRLLRSDVFNRLGVTVVPDTLAGADAQHYYGPYIQALDELRQALGIADTPEDKLRFCLDLLSIPIRARSGYILGRGYKAGQAGANTFVAVFSRANSVLNRKQL